MSVLMVMLKCVEIHTGDDIANERKCVKYHS